MSGWPAFFLGIIALATLVMAAVQIGVIVLVARLSRRVNHLSDLVEREIKPVIANVSAISASVARAASVAATQMERADRLLADLIGRVDETITIIQNVVLVPAREGRALLAAIAAAAAAFREIRAGRASRSTALDEEDPLFIG